MCGILLRQLFFVVAVVYSGSWDFFYGRCKQLFVIELKMLLSQTFIDPVRKVATPLRELTCHMGSHSVTCHPAEVTFRPFTTAEAGTRLSDPGGMQS